MRKKHSIAALFALGALSVMGQGFPSTSINWNTPAGGKLTGGVNFGFNGFYGFAASSDNTGSQGWGMFDLNGDGFSDLVVTAQLQGGNVTCFSPGSGQYWKVYYGNGTGFSGTAANWSLPTGGKLTGGVTYGFDSFAGFASGNDNTGSQTWSIEDINGDKKLDLVVTAQLQGGNVTCFSPGSAPYWKVYLNNGVGFSGTAINWPLPVGGKLTGGVTYGFDFIAGSASSADNTGSQSWQLLDVTGDSKAELVVTAQLQGGNVTCFSPGSGQYWKVYANNGSGFGTAASNWTLPIGGRLSGGVTYGFDDIGGMAASADNTGSQSWFLLNIMGDNKPELIVTAQLQGGNVTCFSPGSGQFWKVYTNTGSSFTTTPVNWNLPIGGKLTGGVTYGYDGPSGFASSSDNTGSQSWDLADIDGNGKMDLLVTAQLQGGDVTCFSPGSGAYWKAYSNNGNGFSTTAFNWAIPAGGKLTGGVTYGFEALDGTASSGDNTGSQTWSLADMDGNGKVDLVVTAQLQAGDVTSFSPGASPYWKVYLNKGELGIGETAGSYAAAALTIYPNPASGVVYIKGTQPQALSITNELGQIIKSVTLSAENNYSAQVSGLDRGIYFISGERGASKLIVEH